ncbi:class I SAM-dependent methyltransferase [Aquihabitans sp. G128]|uniref:class I SAM-dependent methyltransferase n=1 Tax=Aquihabitans sp. G128 TaxID=2849779 RepID=UPI001C23F2AF|nr:class I SAM-dependent methyltransferase [Aquihabitans sp. G128]QXC62954.1 class I SAM-dependent methyltransferase [Aquihabitans sp. G128]
MTAIAERATNTTCHLCGGTEGKVVFVDQGVPLRRCASCRHVYSGWSQPDDYDGYWDQGVTAADVDFWDVAHRAVFEEFTDTYLPADGGRLVDIGCGLGYFVQTMRQRRPTWQVDGYELAPGAVRWAHDELGLVDDVHLGRVEEAGIEPGTVDVVTLWDVIEHLPTPQPLLEHLRTLLRPDGYVFVQTPSWPFQIARARTAATLARKGREDRNHLYAKDHVNQFSRRSLTRLALDCGFREPTFEVLKPVLAVDGSRSTAAVQAKLGLYRATRTLWKASGHRLMANPTLFAQLRPA